MYKCIWTPKAPTELLLNFILLCASSPHMNSRAFIRVCWRIATFWKDKCKEEIITLSRAVLNHGSIKERNHSSHLAFLHFSNSSIDKASVSLRLSIKCFSKRVIVVIFLNLHLFLFAGLQK